jgi:hypothetical protein
MAQPTSLLGRTQIALGLAAALWVRGTAVGSGDQPLAQGVGVDQAAGAASTQRAADWATRPDGGAASEPGVDSGFQGLVPDEGRDANRTFDGARHGQSLCFGD